MLRKIMAMSLLCFVFLVNIEQANAGIFGKKKEKREHKQQIKSNKNQNDYIHILELTDEQAAQYKQIRHQEYEQIAPIVEKIKLKHEEMEMLLKSDISPVILDVERNVIKKEMKDYIDEIHSIKVQTEEKIEVLLNEKQKKRYIKLKDDYNKEPEHKTPSRSLGSVKEHTDFIFTPCEGSTKVPACRVEDLLKK